MEWSERLALFRSTYRELANDRRAFDAKRAADASFSAEIEALYNHFVGTFRKYCGNCWHDAFIQLLTMKHATSKSQFRVLAGTLLHDPVNKDVRYMLTPRRLAEQGDDLALRHLAHNPGAVEYFERPLPDNLQEMIDEYLSRVEGVVIPAREPATPEAETKEEVAPAPVVEDVWVDTPSEDAGQTKEAATEAPAAEQAEAPSTRRSKKADAEEQKEVQE